jgi:DNA-binding CsgD family transcriptional regulator
MLSPCVVEFRTPTAAYRIDATRASDFADGGTVVLVALERSANGPIADAELHARFGLSGREIEVARQIGRGASSREIAASLVVSIHTVRRHSERVFTKLGVHTRSAVGAVLTRWAGEAQGTSP